jgi:hypothetical protein
LRGKRKLKCENGNAEEEVEALSRFEEGFAVRVQKRLVMAFGNHNGCCAT